MEKIKRIALYKITDQDVVQRIGVSRRQRKFLTRNRPSFLASLARNTFADSW